MLDKLSMAVGRRRPRARAERRRASETLLRLFVSFQRTRAGAACRSAGAMTDDELKKLCGDLRERCDKLLVDVEHADCGQASAQNDACKAGRTVPAQNPAWVNAYELERELLMLKAGPALLQSLAMLLDRAEAVDAPATKSLRTAYEAVLAAPRPVAGLRFKASTRGRMSSKGQPKPSSAHPPDHLVRPLALAALEAVQWSQAKRFEAAPSKRDVVHRLVGGGLLAFALFVLPYAWFDVEALFQQHLHERDWSWLPLWTALSAGLLGAFFSRLLTVQKYFPTMSIDDIERVGEWESILLRGGVGMIGALVVLVFLQSQMVGGTLFPDFRNMRLAGEASAGAIALPTASLALLVVWSFVAGFSERIVPRILTKTEAQLLAAATTDGGAAKA